MGKTLLELLDSKNKGQFIPNEGSGNPVPVTVPGPQIHGKNYKAMQALFGTKEADIMNADSRYTEEFGKIAISEYGTDATRILTQTDPHRTKQGIKKAADKVGGAIGGKVGAVIGGVTSKLAEFHPKFPDDWTNDPDAPTKMENNFYAGLVNGDYARGRYYNAYHKNSKSKLGKFLQANKNPEQVKNAILPALKSAAVAAAVGLIALGAAKLFSNKNKKKGKEGPAINKPKEKSKPNPAFFNIDKFNKPYFPSTLLINEGYGENGYGLSFRNYSRLRQRNFNIGTLNYLEKDGATIIKDMAPTLDVSQFTDTDNTHGITDYYLQVFKNNTPQTRNEGNVMLSATMLQNNYQPAYQLGLMLTDAGNDSFGYYTANRKSYAPGRAVDDKVQNYSRFVDAEGNAFTAFGKRNTDGSYSDNDIDKGASLSLRYGTNNANLLTITKAKEGDKTKLDTLGDPLDANGNFFAWQSFGSTYSKDFLTDRKNSIFAIGENYSNEITKDNINVENGGLSQKFGASDTNLLKIVDGANNYTFNLKRDDGSTEVLANIKGDYGDNVYTYTQSELAILNVASEEKSRFITGSIGTNVFLKKGYASDVETQIGQQFGDVFISQDVGTADDLQNIILDTKILGLPQVIRWNKKDKPFSANVDALLDKSLSYYNDSTQTQINVSPQINPYHETKTQILVKNKSDIVKVKIAGINFLATVANLSDKNTSNWDSVKPIGSGVNFYLFNNWERSISFDLTMYAESPDDLARIWNKVDRLTSLTMGNPSGDSGSGYGVYGNIVFLTIGDLIGEYGFLSDITMNVDTNSPWEIDPGMQLPFICTLSISFQVVRNDTAAPLPNTAVKDNTTGKTSAGTQEKFTLKNLESTNPNTEKFTLKNLEKTNPKKDKFSL